jgi:hypothetical protein
VNKTSSACALIAASAVASVGEAAAVNVRFIGGRAISQQVH